MSTLYAKYDEQSSGGEICEGDEEDKWPNYEPVYHEFTFEKLLLKKPEWSYESLDSDFDVKSGDTVYVLVARYSSGSTFGSTYGHFSFQGVFKTEDEINEKIKILEYYDNIYNDRNNKLRKKLSYCPWHGYFECLEDYERYRCVVDGRVDRI